MLQKVYEIVNGHCVPRLPRTLDGAPRVIDGERYLTPEQAAAITGRDADELRELHDLVWDDLLTPEDHLAIATGEATAALRGPRVNGAVDVVREALYANWTDEHYALLVAFAAEKKLSLLTGQVVGELQANADGRVVPRFITSIDAVRMLAEANDLYGGQIGPFWCDESGEWKDVWLGKGFPVAARVGVVRRDFDKPIFQVARWDTYAQTYETASGEEELRIHWVKMPDLMLAKCAEALAFRKAFPRELNGLYTRDEMGQADNPRKVARIGPREETPSCRGVVTEDAPRTTYSLKVRLAGDFKMSERVTASVIRDFVQKWPHLLERDEPLFCARVYKEVSKNPSAYTAPIELPAGH